MDPRRIRLALSCLASIGLLSLSSCDNPSCVFGPGNCTGGGGGGSAGVGAATPSAGSWILDGAPELLEAFPSGNDVHPESVLVLEFDESLSEASLSGAFELIDQVFLQPVQLSEAALVGDGRVVILVPRSPLMEGSGYELRLAEMAEVKDLTGQVLADSQGALTTFTVPLQSAEEPVIVTTYPRDAASGQSDLGEVVVVFDRAMDAATFGQDSWIVTVDDAEPSPDPNPEVLTIDGSQGRSTVPQVWSWSSEDSDDQRVSLTPTGGGGSFVLELSPQAFPLLAEDGGTLAETALAFELAELPVPLAVRKHPLTEPEDAIGLANINGATPLLEIELRAPAQVGDRFSILLFGNGPAIDDPLISLVRTVEVAVEGSLIEVLPADLDLLDATTANGAVLADGDIDIAVRHERVSSTTPVMLVDADPARAGVQSLIFDVTPPEITGLGADGSLPDFFRSELAGVVLTGSASEEIRSAIVSLTDLGFDNGADPGVASSTESGLFVTQPVLDATGNGLGIVDAPTAFSLEVFDRALNPTSAPFLGTFTQVAGVGPDAVMSGDPIRVHVYDAISLEPLAGVLVTTDQESGGSVTRIQVATTNASGNALVDSARLGTTVLSVGLEDYDLFTFHGIQSDRVQIPLTPSVTPATRTIGDVLALLPDADVQDVVGQVGDSRVLPEGARLFGVDACSPNPEDTELRCAFGPEVIRAGALGAQSFLAADFDVTFATFTAAAFLDAFALDLPRAPLTGGATESADILLETRLSDLSPAEQAAAALEHVLNEPARVLPDGFGVVSGDPVITIEGLSPGVPGSIPVGLGLPFPAMAGSWDVLSAYAGAARGGADEQNWGSLVSAGTLEPDLFLRAELIDENGARVGRRVRFSTTSGTLDPPDLPVLRLPGANSGAPPYDLSIDNVIEDADSTLGSGLYRALLTDSEGRRWTLWRVDVADGAPEISIHVPQLDLTGLADGTISVQLSAWTWEDFDPEAFLWSEVARQHDLFAHTAVVTYSQP